MTVYSAKTILRHGDLGYARHRIPALVRTGKGTILLFWEARKNSGSDFDEIHLLVKRSDDEGETWGDAIIVHQEPSDNELISIGNPTPVFDQHDGKVWVVFTRNNEEILVTSSADDGQTWASPKDITEAVRPNSWLRYWTGPGHGIQLQHGSAAGRLLIPSYHLEPHTPNGPDICRCHMVYSDDYGTNWQIGSSTELGDGLEERVFETNWWPANFVWAGCECLAAELSDGEIYLTVRNQVRFREQKAFARSQDGGLSWIPLQLQPELPGLKCQSGVLRVETEDDPAMDPLIYTGIMESGERGRRRLAAYRSADGGRTWPNCLILHEGPAAYSDLCQLADGALLCAYEGGPDDCCGGICLTRFKLEASGKMAV